MKNTKLLASPLKSIDTLAKVSNSTNPLAEVSNNTNPLVKVANNTDPLAKVSNNTDPLTRVSNNTSSLARSQTTQTRWRAPCTQKPPSKVEPTHRGLVEDGSEEHTPNTRLTKNHGEKEFTQSHGAQ